MKKVLITGATGFIGGNLVRGNLAKGNSVRAIALPFQYREGGKGTGLGTEDILPGGDGGNHEMAEDAGSRGAEAEIVILSV